MNSNYLKNASMLLLVILLQVLSMQVKGQQNNPENAEQFIGSALSQKEGILSRTPVYAKEGDKKIPGPFYSNSVADKRHGLQVYADTHEKSSTYEYHEHNYLGVNTPMSAVTDASGNTYITGASSNQNSPEGNYVTIKIDATGTQVWETTLPGTEYAGEMGMVSGMDANGALITSGTHWNGLNMDVKTVKYNTSTGAVIWESIFDNSNDGLDIPTAMHVDGFGNTIVSGITYTGSAIRYLTLFYDTNGSLLWSATDTTAFNNTWNEPTAVTTDSSGNVYVTGFAALLNTGQGYWSGYKTIKYDNTGNELWQETYLFERLIDENDPNSGMTYTDSMPQSIAADSNGNCYITGTFDLFGNGRIGTIKYDAGGLEEWVETYRGGTTNTNLTNGHDIKFVDNNTIYVGGRHRSGWIDEGIVLISYDDDGNRNWEEETNSSIQIATSKLIIDDNDLPVIAGLGYDEGTFDQRIRVFRYSDQGSILKETSYFKEQSDTEGIMGLVHLGLDTPDNVYLVMDNFYTATGAVFETVKMHMDSGHDNTDWEEVYGNLFASSTQMLFSTYDKNDNAYVTGRYGTIVNNEYIGTFVLTKYDSQGNVEWEKTFSEQNGNEADGIIAKVNSQGEIIVILIPHPQSTHPLRLKKYSPGGNLIWEEEKVVHNALLRAFFLDDDDNIYIAGSSKINISDPFGAFTTIKFSDSGTELWTEFVTTNDPDDMLFEINSGTVNPQGDIILTGTSGFSTMFSQEVDLTVLKYTSSGVLEWLNKYPQTNFVSSGMDVVTDDSNNIYITGVQQQITNQTEQLLVLKIEDTGDETWGTVYSQTNRLLRPYKIMQDSNGDMITTSSSLYWVPGQPTDNRITTVKLNKDDGDIDWVNNSDLDRYYADSYIDANDEVYIFNQVESSALPYRTGFLAVGGLLKIAPDGTANEELFTAPELALFFPASITPLSNGTLLLGGDISHEHNFFSGFYFFESSHSPLSSEDHQQAGDKKANWLGQNYPNPVLNTTEIPFYLTASEQVKLNLYDSQGRFLFEIVNTDFPKGMNAVPLEKSGLLPGVYFYQIEAGNFKHARKLIVK